VQVVDKEKRGVKVKTRGKLIRSISRIGVLAGFTYVIISLILLASGMPHRHAYTMVLGGLLLLPHSVAIAYIASTALRGGPILLEIVAYLTIPLFVLPIEGVFHKYGLTLAYFAALSLLTAASSFEASSGRKGSIQLSLRLVGLTYILASIGSITAIYLDGAVKFSYLAILLASAYPLPLILSVTSHSLPGTFQDGPNTIGAYTDMALYYATVGLLASLHARLAMAVLAAAALLYVYAGKLYRIPYYRFKIPAGLDRRHPARAGMEYFLKGHYHAIMLSLVVAACSLTAAIRGECWTLGVVHTVVLGFVSIHFMIHGPLMLPVILGVRHAKNYHTLNFHLNTLATILWPINGSASFALYVTALILALLIVAGPRKINLPLI